MAKPKSIAANRRKRRARRKRKNAAHMVMNPPVGRDIAQAVVPGFAAYGATRLLSRIVYTVVQKRWPKVGRHAGALSSVLAATAAWLGAHRIKQLKEYHDPIVIGASIAALQTVFRTYVPRYGWIVSDYRPDDLPGQNPKQIGPADEEEELDQALKDYMAEDEYSHLEREVEPPSPAPSHSPAPSLADDEGFDDDDLDALDVSNQMWPN